ncbi:hypothetical protein HT585_31465 [Ensifer sp. HO-A22]|uniref:Uncharacterized protein n=1 Tax=Ensifer oleiphilus TaxID=2742698 RepID=A0A7Y6URI5_9HYPH|nr:hypothetical protein [Ensifer oleiphilus]
MLNDNDIATLRSFTNAGDRISYYQYLIEKGDRYAALAQGVVTNSNLAGAVANAFAVHKASQIANISLTSGDLAQISLDLMQADFNARLQSSNGMIGRSQITQYHIDVFAAHNLPPQAWTAYIPLSLAETEGTADALWDQLLDPNFYSATSFLDQIALLVGNKINDPVLGGGWNQDVTIAFAAAATTGAGSHAYGNFQVSWGEVANVIGGSQHSDTLLGSDLNDVIMTFDGGSNSADGGSGNDRIHGGFYVDELKGGDGRDAIFGYGEGDRIIGGHGSDYIDGGDGNDVITAGEFEEVEPGRIVHVDGGNDTIFAGDGRDTVEIVAGYDIVSLGSGDDEIAIQNNTGRAVIWGGAGNDSLTFTVGGTVLFVDAPNVSDQLLKNLDQDSLRDHIRSTFPIFQEAIVTTIVINVDQNDKIKLGDNHLNLFNIEEERTDYPEGDWIFDYTSRGYSTDDGYEVYWATSQTKTSGYNIQRDIKLFGNEASSVTVWGGDVPGVRVDGLDVFGLKSGDAGILLPSNKPSFEEHLVKTTRAIQDDGVTREVTYDHLLKRIYYTPANVEVVGEETNQISSTYGSDLVPPDFYSGTRPQIDLNQFQKDPAVPPQEDPIQGTDGDDVLTGSVNNDLIYGAAGDDVIDGRAGADEIAGELGNDTLRGGTGSDAYTYARGDGDDTIIELVGGGANDTLRLTDVALGEITFVRNGSDLNVVVAESEPGAGDGGAILLKDTLGGTNGQGIETIVFADGSKLDLNSLEGTGSAADDRFVGNGRQQNFSGRGGFDTVSYEHSLLAVQVNLKTGQGVGGDADRDTYDSIEGVVGSRNNDELNGSDAGNKLYGSGGNDILYGGLGDDILDGGAGDNDQVNYDGYATDYVFRRNADGTTAVHNSEYGDDTLVSIKGVWFLAEAAWYDLTRLHSNRGSNDVWGTAGDDYLEGTQAGDVIHGGEGSDTLYGGRGDDTLLGEGGGYNQVDYDGKASDYIFVRNADGTTTVVSDVYGTDILSEIHGVWFRGEEQWRSLSSLHENRWIGTDDVVSTTSGTAIDLNQQDNDIIPAGANVVQHIWTQPQHGSVEWNEQTRTFTYTPDAGFVGTDTLIYGLHDGDNGGAVMTPEGVKVTIRVGPGDPTKGQTVTVGQGADYYGGTALNDTINFVGGAGNYVNGGDGNDIIVFSGSSADYKILGQGDHFTISHLTNGDIVQFTAVEDIGFANGIISLDDIIANSGHLPGDTWFEPEPIGGLV